MELKTNLQKRVAFQPTGLIMREDNDKQTIEGVAIVVNRETVLWEGSTYREIEVIDPSAISAEFIATQDIKLNLLHERALSFARTGGSLVLDTREDGLHFSAPGDDSAIARQATDLIKNGTYTGCSFEFWSKDYTVTERKAADGKTEYVIRHISFARIGAITIGMDPAYEETSVGLRELYQEINNITDEGDADAEAKREAELKAKAEEAAKVAAEAAEREKFTRERSLSAMQKELELMELQTNL